MFPALLGRITAGRRLAREAAARPANLVQFDVLAAVGDDLTGPPPHQRRARLKDLLADAPPALVLCPRARCIDIYEVPSPRARAASMKLHMAGMTLPMPATAHSRAGPSLQAGTSTGASPMCSPRWSAEPRPYQDAVPVVPPGRTCSR